MSNGRESGDPNRFPSIMVRSAGCRTYGIDLLRFLALDEDEKLA
jgi:hypothetical protein